jgi:hypothetical protein
MGRLLGLPWTGTEMVVPAMPLTMFGFEALPLLVLGILNDILVVRLRGFAGATKDGGAA